MMRFTGKQYLQMDIASNFGLEKADWNERLQWFADNEHQLFSLVTRLRLQLSTMQPCLHGEKWNRVSLLATLSHWMLQPLVCRSLHALQAIVVLPNCAT